MSLIVTKMTLFGSLARFARHTRGPIDIGRGLVVTTVQVVGCGLQRLDGKSGKVGGRVERDDMSGRFDGPRDARQKDLGSVHATPEDLAVQLVQFGVGHSTLLCRPWHGK